MHGRVVQGADTPVLRGGALWRRWTLATALGELAGFTIPALAGVLAAWLKAADAGMAAALVVAGMGEGAVLGMAQWLVLRRAIPSLGRRAWVRATALAAGFAWAIGLLPAMAGGFAALDPLLLAAGMLLLGVPFLCSIGGAQWLVLRRYIPRAGWWVLANAIAWPLGVAVPVTGLGLLPDGAGPLVMIAVGIVCGLLMGVVVGAITGAALVRLLPGPPRPAGVGAALSRP